MGVKDERKTFTLLGSSSSAFPAMSLGFNIVLLLLRSLLYLWGSTLFFFFCVPCYIFGVQHYSSSSLSPAISLGFTILLLHSQLYLWGSPLFFFFCVPSYISLGFTIILRFQLYLWSSPFFFCVPCYIFGVQHYSSSSLSPAISLGFIIILRSQLYLWSSPFFFCVPSYISWVPVCHANPLYK